MSIFAKLEADALAILKAAGHIVETFVITEAQQLVAQVKQTYVGTVATSIITALDSTTLSGPDKLATVVAAVVPLIAKLAASGGVTGAITSVESFALEFVQSAYNDAKRDAAAKV